MLLRRYRRPLLLALPLGFGIGCLVFVVLLLSGNSAWRANLRAEAVLSTWITYVVIGLTVAAAAAAGAIVALLITDRHVRRAPSARLWATALGAAIGVVALGFAVQIWEWAAIGTTSTLVLYITVWVAIAAAIIATIPVAAAERRAARELADRSDPYAKRYGRGTS